MNMSLLTTKWIIGRLRILPYLTILYFFFSTPGAIAQFLEAGVGKLKMPVEAPEFTLRGVNSETISLKELKGKVVILNFFGTR